MKLKMNLNYNLKIYFEYSKLKNNFELKIRINKYNN